MKNVPAAFHLKNKDVWDWVVRQNVVLALEHFKAGRAPVIVARWRSALADKLGTNVAGSNAQWSILRDIYKLVLGGPPKLRKITGKKQGMVGKPCKYSQVQVDDWNESYPPGSRCWIGNEIGTTDSPAWVTKGGRGQVKVNGTLVYLERLLMVDAPTTRAAKPTSYPSRRNNELAAANPPDL